MSNPFSGNLRPAQVARYMQSPDRLASMLQDEMPGWEHSPAEIFADIVTVMRADTRQLGQQFGVDVPADRMTEDRAADLIAGITDGDAIELVLVFNELARQRDLVLKEALDDDEYQQFMDAKTSVMLTDDPDTWDDEDDVDDHVQDVEFREVDDGE